MSLLQPHSSPDKAADYTTCSGKRIACACSYAHLYVCVYTCHLTQSGHLLIVRSQVRNAYFLINTLSRTPISALEAQSVLSHTHSPTYPDWVTPAITRTHTCTHSIKCDWVSKPLNESGWLDPGRVCLTFPSTSSPPRACVFLWVSGCKLSGPRHFTSNVTDLNEMARQMTEEGKKGGEGPRMRENMRKIFFFFQWAERRELKKKQRIKKDWKRARACHRSISCLGFLPLCMRNSKAGVFLNSSLVVGIQRRPLWVHKPPPPTVEMVESALPCSQSSDGQRGRRSESGLRGAGRGQVRFRLWVCCATELLRVKLVNSRLIFMGSGSITREDLKEKTCGRGGGGKMHTDCWDSSFNLRIIAVYYNFDFIAMDDCKIFCGLILTLGHDNITRAERSVDKQKIYWQLFW